MTAIPVGDLRFYWDRPLGRGSTPMRIDRSEVFIAGPPIRGNPQPMWYGQIRFGLLYVRELPPPGVRPWVQTDPGVVWRRYWERIFAGDTLTDGELGEFYDAGRTLRENIQTMVNSRRCGEQLVIGGQYRFWVDYWIIAWNGFQGNAYDPDEQDTADVEPMPPVEHRLGDGTWHPPVPDLWQHWRGWQPVTIPAPARGEGPSGQAPTRISLACRRYALIRRLHDVTQLLQSRLEQIQDRLSMIGEVRSHLECLRRLTGFSFENDLRINQGGSWWSDTGEHYAYLADSFRQMSQLARVYLYEESGGRRQVQLANDEADKIWNVLTTPGYWQDITAREVANQHSDQIRDFIAQAHLALVSTPPPVRIQNFRGTTLPTGTRLAIPLPDGSQRCYIMSYTWDGRYNRRILGPFLRNAGQTGGFQNAVSRASPLFAVRENITFIANSIANRLDWGEHREMARRVYVLLREQGRINSSVSFDRALQLSESRDGVRQFARPSSGVAGVALTSGLTLIMKAAVLHERWDRAWTTTSGTDVASAIHATVDFGSNALGFVGDCMSLMSDLDAAYAQAVSRWGGPLGCVSDGISAGIYFHTEFCDVSGRQSDIDMYGEAFANRLLAYNMVSMTGQTITTAGSALMCSAVFAPLGITVKAIGLTVTNLTELVAAIDTIGERERELLTTIWERLRDRYTAFRDFYDAFRTSVDPPLSGGWGTISPRSRQVQHWVEITTRQYQAIRAVYRELSSGGGGGG